MVSSFCVYVMTCQVVYNPNSDFGAHRNKKHKRRSVLERLFVHPQKRLYERFYVYVFVEKESTDPGTFFRVILFEMFVYMEGL